MLWAYFDETAVNAVHGKDGKLRPTEMFVGGCVATAPQWEKFTPKWRRALDRAGVVFTSMASIKDHGTRKAYQDAILRAFYDATKFRMRGKDSLYIVLARHPEFSPWSILRRFEQIDWEKKLAGCGIFQPDDVLPLQAADYVLHSLNKAWGGMETPALKRLQEGCAKRNKPFHQQIASSLNVEKLFASLQS
jgi:hypothetical protein